MTFKATEFQNNEATGRVEIYSAANFNEALGNLLYTRRLTNGNAFVGPTGRVVHAGSKCYTLTPGK
jgi:hypothetical protein